MNLSSGIYDPLSLDLNIQLQDGTQVPITQTITGGKLYGLLRFRDEVLNPTRNELGLLAVGVTETFNAQHQLGLISQGVQEGILYPYCTHRRGSQQQRRGRDSYSNYFRCECASGSGYRLQWTGNMDANEHEDRRQHECS